MIHSVRILALTLAALLAACSSPPSPRVTATPVRQGMSGAELVAAFGRALRVQRTAEGGEDWFYNFGSQQSESHPISESTVTETERSYSTGNTTSTTTTMHQAPIHLSPGGRVVGSIPPGHIVVQ